MNTALIKKYKKEFDHYLNEGKVLMNIPNDVRGWMLPDWNLPNTALVIIDDEYTEFRKAEAEGKQIQFRTKENSKWVDSSFKSWDKSFKYSDTEFRIKPEEHYFKVGDFVRVTPKSEQALTNCNVLVAGRIRYISDNQFNIGNETITDWFLIEDFIKWEPQSNELCWFADSLEQNSAYMGTYKLKNSYGYFTTTNACAWKYCEPFLNSKPSWFTK